MKSKTYLLLFFILISNTLSLFAQQSKLDTLSIISFNDFHGAFAKDEGLPGAGELVQMILNEKQKCTNTIVISAGDNFSGSYFSRITGGKPLPEMFKAVDLKLSAIGNHEFDWGLPYLKDSASIYTNYIGANITTNGSDMPNWLKPYKIVSQTLKDGSTLRIAFIGLTTTDTAHKTSPENVAGLEFIHPLGAACVQSLYKLKCEGVIDMIVLVAHIGTDMADIDRIIEANAKALPFMDKVDAIISGHSHKVVLDKVNNVPIIQAGVNGLYIGKLMFQIRTNGNRHDISYIMGDTIRTKCKGNVEMTQLVNKYMDIYSFNKKITKSKDSLINDRNVNKSSYTALGAYVTASYVDCFTKYNTPSSSNIIIGINHFGGIRANIAKGDVTKLRAGNVLPFGGNVTAYNFNGKRLKMLLNEGRANKNGYLQSSYLELNVNKNDSITAIYYTKNNRRVEIADNTSCIVVLDSYITTGGDGYSSSLFSGYEIIPFNNLKKETTTAFIDYLSHQKVLSIKDAPTPCVKNENK